MLHEIMGHCEVPETCKQALNIHLFFSLCHSLCHFFPPFSMHSCAYTHTKSDLENDVVELAWEEDDHLLGYNMTEEIEFGVQGFSFCYYCFGALQ